jgi:hypothetical protein
VAAAWGSGRMLRLLREELLMPGRVGLRARLVSSVDSVFES